MIGQLRPHRDTLSELLSRLNPADHRNFPRLDLRDHFALARNAGKLAGAARDLKRPPAPLHIAGAIEFRKDTITLFTRDDALGVTRFRSLFQIGIYCAWANDRRRM